MKQTILILLFICGILTSCVKEEKPLLEITSVESRVVSINTSDECINNGEPGTQIEVTIRFKAINLLVETLVNQYKSDSGDGGKEDYSISHEDSDSGILSFSNWCYWFEDSNYFEEKYRLKGMTMEGALVTSNEVVLRIDRPDGAN